MKNFVIEIKKNRRNCFEKVHYSQIINHRYFFINQIFRRIVSRCDHNILLKFRRISCIPSKYVIYSLYNSCVYILYFFEFRFHILDIFLFQELLMNYHQVWISNLYNYNLYEILYMLSNTIFHTDHIRILHFYLTQIWEIPVRNLDSGNHDNLDSFKWILKFEGHTIYWNLLHSITFEYLLY